MRYKAHYDKVMSLEGSTTPRLTNKELIGMMNLKYEQALSKQGELGKAYRDLEAQLKTEPLQQIRHMLRLGIDSMEREQAAIRRRENRANRAIRALGTLKRALDGDV